MFTAEERKTLNFLYAERLSWAVEQGGRASFLSDTSLKESIEQGNPAFSERVRF